jgi:ligand-binding SRPBCC domain-containing protein
MQILKQDQILSISLKEALDYFSNPVNLKTITPPYMGFDVISKDLPQEIYQGMIITYKVKPLFRIPLNWLTEITQVRAPFFFVDNQKSGPFAVWHHQHFFEKHEKGVRMCDLVHYAAPMGVLGKMAERAIVKRRVAEIFDYRYQKLEELFG